MGIQKFRQILIVLACVLAIFCGCSGNPIGGGDTHPVPVIPEGPRDWYGVWNPVRDIIAYEHDPVDSYSKPPGIYIVNSDGSGDSLIILYGAFPSWSPSGDTLAFVSNVDFDLYVYSFIDNSTHRLTTTGDNRYTTYSSDGKSIAVSANGNEIRRWHVKVFNLTSGEWEYVGRRASGDIDEWLRPHWVPDQSKILFEGTFGLFMIDLATDSVGSYLENCFQGAWSKSGDSLCFVRKYRTSFDTIIRQTNSGKEVNIGQRIFPNFSRDGGKIVYSQPTKVDWRGLETMRYFLRIHDLQSGADYQLTN